jgi:MFS family permease
MLIVIGLAIVLGSVLGGFLPHGDLRVLWQPLEVLIILGAALGAFIIANPLSVQLGVLRGLKVLFRDAPHPKAAYLELLTLLYTLFKLARSKGMLALETHLEHPYESELFPLGSAVMYPYAEALMAKVATIMSRTGRMVSVTGHTDAIPFQAGSQRDNWQLSSDRANASRRALIAAGLPEDRIARVVGKADTEPLDPDHPDAAKNRRISIVLLRKPM